MEKACIYYDPFRHGDGPCWVARWNDSEHVLDIENPMARDRDLWLCAREIGAPADIPVVRRVNDLKDLRALALSLYGWSETILNNDPEKAKSIHDIADTIYEWYEILVKTDSVLPWQEEI